MAACLVGQVQSNMLSMRVEGEEEAAFHSGNSNFKAQAQLVDGLSWTFYQESCPQLESIIYSTLMPFLDDDITQAAGLLRLHFHDCFVQGCDASVLLDGSTSGPSEQSAIPNLTLRPEAFEIINAIKANVEELCPNIVSCADIVALAARDSVVKAKGPYYPVPLGRRDSLLFANTSITLANLPPPTANVTGLMDIFSTKGLDLIDLVALSGGHTIGRAHCASFASRLDPLDPNLNTDLASTLTSICPTSNSTNFTNMDTVTPNQFDNNYYRGLLQGYGLFTSDSALVVDARTNATVQSFYSNKIRFFMHFGFSMIKMGQLEVLTGTEGEIRTNCSAMNSASLLTTV
ncbi:hypothetical protein GOP47_0029147 [Adiantum capillus-veneris]|nr:hypothetical protein GOP47_0029147 [Adiantum capillus-veneris]